MPSKDFTASGVVAKPISVIVFASSWMIAWRRPRQMIASRRSKSIRSRRMSCAGMSRGDEESFPRGGVFQAYRDFAVSMVDEPAQAKVAGKRGGGVRLVVGRGFAKQLAQGGAQQALDEVGEADVAFVFEGAARVGDGHEPVPGLREGAKRVRVEFAEATGLRY